MLATSVRVRLLVAPVCVFGALSVATCSGHPTEPAPALVDVASNTQLAAPDTRVVNEPEVARIDLVAELRAIGAGYATMPQSGETACTRPSRNELAGLHTRIATWIDRRYRAEAPDASEQLDFDACISEQDGALIVDANADRSLEDRRFGRWWILRVTDEAVEVIAERTSTAKVDWMEWADEGSVHTLAIHDVDADGALDIVWSNTEHEGGAMTSQYAVSVTRGGTDDVTRGGTVRAFWLDGTVDAAVVDGALVIGRGRFDDELTYRCLGADFKLQKCPAAAKLERAARIQSIVDQYRSMTNAFLPDRKTLAEELALLGIPTAERARLLDAR